MSTRVQELFQAKIKKVVLAYERGQEIKVIAQETGVSPPTITKWLIQEGYRRRKKGRVPLAMKARILDLKSRGWELDQISSLLRIDLDQAREWSKPFANPILGGEKDPLKIKGQKKRKKDKVRGRGRGRPPKPSKKKDKWPPDRHKCDKHWTPLEKSYVIELIEKGISPLAIYRKTRASRKRQIKIWREGGGAGFPPNFPPPKGPFRSGAAPESAEQRKAAIKAFQKSAEDRLKQLEDQAAERQRRIAELEAQVAQEEKIIQQLESQRKKLAVDLREKAERLAQAQAAMKKREIAESRGRRVLPGSYEQEALGLEPGTKIEPGKPGRPSLPRPAHLGGYADNEEFFAISRDWKDLEDATDDELALFASYLTSRGFPSRVESSGDQPRAYFESTWPKKVESKWNSAVDSGLELIEKYKDRKSELQPKKMFSKGIARYLAKAYSAFEDPAIPSGEKSELKDELLDDWARLKKIDRLILIFSMGSASSDGLPTSEGIIRGRAAKILLEKASRAAAGELSARLQESEKKKMIRQAERDEVDAILSGARLALESGEGS